MFVNRTLATAINTALDKYPFVCVLGPRQSGKTSLCKAIVPHYTYVNLEDFSMREFAKEDPKGFLSAFPHNVILDEIQYVPNLFSYLQVHADQLQLNGAYLLIGSQNLLLSEQISQSLAGRIALFNLLPFSLSELKSAGFASDQWEYYAFQGAYPRLWINRINPTEFYSNYLKTYVERDVRLIKNIVNLDLFQRFILLLAGRVGQLFNQSSIGVELGIDNKTVNAWMGLLENSFIAFRLKPYHSNFNKRITQTPKVYFYDIGLLTFLLGIRSENDIHLHFAKGAVFENLVILEKIKRSYHQHDFASFYFFRDSSGNEIDLIIEQGLKTEAIEIKSGRTIQSDFFKHLIYFKKLKPSVTLQLIHAGKDTYLGNEVEVSGFEAI